MPEKRKKDDNIYNVVSLLLNNLLEDSADKEGKDLLISSLKEIKRAFKRSDFGDNVSGWDFGVVFDFVNKGRKPMKDGEFREEEFLKGEEFKVILEDFGITKENISDIVEMIK